MWADLIKKEWTLWNVRKTTKRPIILSLSPRFRCLTLDCSDQTIWVALWWRGATQNTWSGKRLSRTMVWKMVALRSDQRAKSGKRSGQWSHYGLIRWQSLGKWSGQWSHYGLIRGKSLGKGLDNGHTTVWSEGKVWEMVWTMVALRSDQRAKLHYSLIIGRTKVWTIVALRCDRRPKSGHK